MQGRRATKTQKAHCPVSPEHEGITSHYQDLPAPPQCSPKFKPEHIVGPVSTVSHSFSSARLPTWLLADKALLLALKVSTIMIAGVRQQQILTGFLDLKALDLSDLSDLW